MYGNCVAGDIFVAMHVIEYVQLSKSDRLKKK